MSKIYNEYIKLKEKNDEKIYLFECGNFYIALDSDAIVLNEELGLKLTKFSNLCDKCGFPITAVDKYIKIIEDKNIEYELVKSVINSDKKISLIKDMIKKSNFEEKSHFELIDLIKSINDIIKE